jgi:hypothetical protein
MCLTANPKLENVVIARCNLTVIKVVMEKEGAGRLAKGL